MLWIWLIGWYFTAGLIDPKDKMGFLSCFHLGFIWPIKLGKFVRERLDGK